MPPRSYFEYMMSRAGSGDRREARDNRPRNTNNPDDMEMAARSARLARGPQSAGAGGRAGVAGSSLADRLRSRVPQGRGNVQPGIAEQAIRGLSGPGGSLNNAGIYRDETGTWKIDFAKNAAGRASNPAPNPVYTPRTAAAPPPPPTTIRGYPRPGTQTSTAAPGPAPAPASGPSMGQQPPGPSGGGGPVYEPPKAAPPITAPDPRVATSSTGGRVVQPAPGPSTQAGTLLGTIKQPPPQTGLNIGRSVQPAPAPSGSLPRQPQGGTLPQQPQGGTLPMQGFYGAGSQAAQQLGGGGEWNQGQGQAPNIQVTPSPATASAQNGSSQTVQGNTNSVYRHDVYNSPATVTYGNQGGVIPRQPQFPTSSQTPSNGMDFGGAIRSSVDQMIQQTQQDVMARMNQPRTSGLAGLAGLGDRIRADVHSKIFGGQQGGFPQGPMGQQPQGPAGPIAPPPQGAGTLPRQGPGTATTPAAGAGIGQPVGTIPNDLQIAFGRGADWGAVNTYDRDFVAQGGTYGVDPSFLKSIMVIESGGQNIRNTNGNPWGGVMQIHDQWADEARAAGIDINTDQGQIQWAAKMLGDYKAANPGATDEDAFLAVYYPVEGGPDAPSADGHTQNQYLSDLRRVQSIINGQGDPTQVANAQVRPSGQSPTAVAAWNSETGQMSPGVAQPPGTIPRQVDQSGMKSVTVTQLPNAGGMPQQPITLPPTMGQIPQVSGDPTAQQIAEIANLYVGVVPYEGANWNGNSGKGIDPRNPAENGWDCSGMVYWLDQNYGTGELPQGSHEQYDYLNAHDPNFHARDQAVQNGDYSSLKPGDLIYIDSGASYRGNAASHVMVYMGDGKFVNAANETDGTTIWNGIPASYPVLGVATYW